MPATGHGDAAGQAHVESPAVLRRRPGSGGEGRGALVEDLLQRLRHAVAQLADQRPFGRRHVLHVRQSSGQQALLAEHGDPRLFQGFQVTSGLEHGPG